MAQTCVLFHKPPVPKLSQLELVLSSYRIHHPNRFHHNLRMSPKTFDAILNHIRDDPVFYSDSNNAQLPPSYQLAVFLWQMGHFGNVASVSSIAQWARCSEGTVWHCTRWCMIAVMQLHPHAFAKPNHHEIAQAKAWVERTSCKACSKGWCMVDGTLVPLSDKPGHHGPAYFDCKSNYSLNVQVTHLIQYSVLRYLFGAW